MGPVLNFIFTPETAIVDQKTSPLVNRQDAPPIDARKPKQWTTYWLCNVNMYACMYACLYVHMYVCMHVGRYVRMYVRKGIGRAVNSTAILIMGLCCVMNSEGEAASADGFLRAQAPIILCFLSRPLLTDHITTKTPKHSIFIMLSISKPLNLLERTAFSESYVEKFSLQGYYFWFLYCFVVGGVLF